MSSTGNDRYLDSLLPEDFYRRIADGTSNLQYYPAFSDRAKWRKAAKSSAAAQILKFAAEIPENEVPALLYSNYRQFQTNGNRSEYEALYFQRRYRLSVLVLALCLTGDKALYMPRLMDHLIAILEEWTWCVPAHMVWLESGPFRFRPADLFCSETGAILALTVQVLGEELEKEWQGITEWIRRQTLERTVYNVIYNKDCLPHHWWFTGKKPENWSVWCGYNNLVALFQFERDPAKLARLARKFVHVVSRFAACYEDDGYCAEGAMYYTKAGMMLFRAIDLLDKIQPGCGARLYREPKIRAIFEFLANVRIGDGFVVAFGDSVQNLPINTCYTTVAAAAAAIGSATLAGLEQWYMGELMVAQDILNETLGLFFDLPQKKKKSAAAPEQPVTLFPGRLGVLRSEKFSASLKGGSNQEPHNHNDMGHFTVFYNGAPIIMDAGTGGYSRINFSDKRYTLWYTRGNGHNAPVIGGHEQQAGADYTATLDMTPDRKNMICDLGKAYPVAAGVKQFIRTLTFEPERVIVSDQIKLKKKQPLEIFLLSPEVPRLQKDGTILLGGVRLTLSGLTWSGDVEEMPVLRKQRPFPALQMKRFRLTASAGAYSLIFTAG